MPQDTESRSLDKVIVRLPDGMRDNIARVAKRNGRSMNAEIVAVLEERFPSVDKLRKTIEELEGFLDFLPQDQRQPLKDQIDKLNRDFYAAHGGVFE